MLEIPAWRSGSSDRSAGLRSRQLSDLEATGRGVGPNEFIGHIRVCIGENSFYLYTQICARVYVSYIYICAYEALV